MHFSYGGFPTFPPFLSVQLGVFFKKMAKKFTVILDDDEINAVKELIKTTDIHSLLSSHETSVNYGILYQILEQDKDDTQ